MKINDLPNDIDELKKLLVKSNQEISLKDEKLKASKDEIDNLKDTILLLRRKRFAPTSEANSDQLNIFNELEEIIEINQDQENEKEIVTYKRKQRGKRVPLSDNIPRRENVIDIPENQKDGMRYIGDEVSEKLVIEPATIYVERTIRKKYAPISDESKKMLIAKLPESLLPKTMATPSLIAYIITAKYVDSLPLYRQEKIFERISASLNRQTMARWLIQVSEKLVPLYNLLQEKILESSYLQMDETTVQVLNEKGKKATSKSYMWLRHRPGGNPIILFDYASNRSGDVPVDLLEGFKGHLQVDGYDGYARACREYNLIRVGCWDHARRKFFDASKTSKGKGVGKKGVLLIDKLYKIERKIKGLPLNKKLKERVDQATPILEELKEWIDDIKSKITPKSIAGQAITYAYNEWKYLIAYLEDPNLHISNILIENAVRPFAVGRRNWLFSASVSGAQASAMYLSLIETAKKNNFEPFDYLNKMLEKLPTAKTVDDFEKLLPLKDSFQV